MNVRNSYNKMRAFSQRHGKVVPPLHLNDVRGHPPGPHRLQEWCSEM